MRESLRSTEGSQGLRRLLKEPLSRHVPTKGIKLDELWETLWMDVGGTGLQYFNVNDLGNVVCGLPEYELCDGHGKKMSAYADLTLWIRGTVFPKPT